MGTGDVGVTGTAGMDGTAGVAEKSRGLSVWPLRSEGAIRDNSEVSRCRGTVKLVRISCPTIDSASELVRSGNSAMSDTSWSSSWPADTSDLLGLRGWPKVLFSGLLGIASDDVD